MNAIRNQFAEIVDYAGLFPPAKLPLAQVLRNHAAYSRSEQSWMLARLVVPALKLEAFAREMEIAVPDHSSGQGEWLISALLPRPGDAEFEDALNAISRFNSTGQAGRPQVDAVEVAVATPEEIGMIPDRVPHGIATFIEIPHSNCEDHFKRLAQENENRSGLFAKIRTGGITPDLIPQIDEVADFIMLARESGVGFKATAGLHHAVRGEYPLTYEPDSDFATMHGFLNVFVGAALVHSGKIDRHILRHVLSETRIGAFVLEDSSCGWREHRTQAAELKQARTDFAISFGSCSFSEPVEELARAGLLAVSQSHSSSSSSSSSQSSSSSSQSSSSSRSSSTSSHSSSSKSSSSS